jgi:hypothetical protein
VAGLLEENAPHHHLRRKSRAAKWHWLTSLRQFVTVAGALLKISFIALSKQAAGSLRGEIRLKMVRI